MRQSPYPLGSVFTWSQKFWIAVQSCSDTLGSVALSAEEIKNIMKTHISSHPRTMAAQGRDITPLGNQTE